MRETTLVPTMVVFLPSGSAFAYGGNPQDRNASPQRSGLPCLHPLPIREIQKIKYPARLKYILEKT